MLLQTSGVVDPGSIDGGCGTAQDFGIAIAKSLAGILQAFTVPQPVWLKYLQFHFISHYGTEPICALNDILVHGKSAAEDLEDQLSASSLLPEDDLQDDPKPQGPKDGSAEHHQAQAAPDAAPTAVQDTKQASVQADGAKAGLLMAENTANDSKSLGSNNTQDGKEQASATCHHHDLLLRSIHSRSAALNL